MTQLFGPAMAKPYRALARPLQAANSADAAYACVFLEAPSNRTEVQKIMNNSITIVGHVGQAPHSVSFGDTGNKVVKFSVAVKEFSSNTDEERTMWIDVDAWKD